MMKTFTVLLFCILILGAVISQVDGAVKAPPKVPPRPPPPAPSQGPSAPSPTPYPGGKVTCPPVDIIFVIDTSGSMSDEGAALCPAITNVLTQLKADGITVAQSKVFGIVDTALKGVKCFNGNLYSMYGAPVPGNDPCPWPAINTRLGGQESWGPGTSIVAKKFPWTPGAVRVIVPISDEGPCQGNNEGKALGDSNDANSVANAINMAKQAGVIVSPIRGTNDPSYTAAQYADVLKFMNQLASGTGGIVTQSQGVKSSVGDMSNNIVSIVRRACIVAAGSKPPPPPPSSPPSQSRIPPPPPSPFPSTTSTASRTSAPTSPASASGSQSHIPPPPPPSPGASTSNSRSKAPPPPSSAPSMSSTPAASRSSNPSATRSPAPPVVTIPVGTGQDPSLPLPKEFTGFYKDPGMTGIATTGSWVDPQGIKHTYYIYDQNGGLQPGQCYDLPPQAVRDAVPKGDTLFLSSVTSDPERQYLTSLVKSQKSPYTFDRLDGYVVDNFYDANTKEWVSFNGKCRPGGYIPWGDYNSCCDDKEPNTMDPSTIVEYCTAMDFHNDLACTPDKCTNPQACTPPTPRDRKCFYDGVYNNFPCLGVYTGCLYESVPAANISTTNFGCRRDPTSICPNNLVNVIKNPGFETGQYYPGRNSFTFIPKSYGLFGWHINTGAVKAFLASVFPPASGLYGLQLNALGTGSNIQQWFSLDDNVRRIYTISFKASSQPGAVTSPILINIYNPSGNNYRSYRFAIPTTTNVNYQTYTFTFNSVVGNKFYLFTMSTETLQAGALIDDFQMCSGDIATEPVINNICDVQPTTITLYSGWDVFPTTTPKPTLTYQLKGTTFTATVFLPGETKTRRLGMHFLYPSTPQGVADCKSGPTAKYSSFGNLILSQPACGGPTNAFITRQSINQIGGIIDLIKADNFITTPATMNGVAGHQATLVATGVQEGQWKFEFTVRQGLSSDPNSADLGVMWQSGSVFGQTITVNVCPVAGVCPIGNQILSNTNFDQGSAYRAYSGPTISSVGSGNGQYDVLNPNNGATLSNWKVVSGTILWGSALIQSTNPPRTSYNTIGLLPGSSISQTFSVPADYTAYGLTFFSVAHPWNSAATKTTQQFFQLTVDIRATTTGGQSTPQKTIKINANDAAQQLTYNWIVGETPSASSRQYTITFSLAGTPQAGIVVPSTYNYGVLVGFPTMCTTATPSVVGNNDYCAGQPQYLSNNYFTPDAASTTAGETNTFIPIRSNSNRINPWKVSVGEVDHIFEYWQEPAGAHYSVDLSGSTAGMFMATIQQQFILPSVASIYSLKYALAGNPDGEPQTKHLRVQIVTATGTVVYDQPNQISVAGRTKQNMGWTEKLVPFTSVAGQTTYIVKFSSLDDTAFGPVIGNAFVCGIAPATPIPDLHPLVCNNGQTNNAISNGNFEYLSFTNNLPWSVVYSGSTGIQSWSVTAGTVEVYTAAGWKPYSKQNTIDMSGISAGTIAQTVHLPGGFPWTLTFAMTGNPGVPPQTKSMQVTLYQSNKALTPVVTKKFDWTTAIGENAQNMNYEVQSLSFNAVAGVDDYILEFKSLTPGYFGMVIDDVRICSPSVMVYPPTGKAPAADTEPTMWTITADNSFEMYVDGTEIPPSDAAAISKTDGCAGKTMASPIGKYCCDNTASAASPRCDWTKSEKFEFPIKSSGSVVAIHVENFATTKGGDARSTDPIQGGANPAALLVSYVNQGRQCGVSDVGDWLCTFSVTDAEKQSGVWTSPLYDDSKWSPPSGFGLNGPGSFTVFGGTAATLYKGHSIWYSGAGQIQGIPTFAQWIWGATGQAGAYQEMWCRTHVPNLYC